jgi:DnaK suppressor protein
MDAFTLRQQMYRLERRRDEITLALKRLGKDRSEEAEQNTDWLDQAEIESRLTRLDHLNDAYVTELKQIDKALERIGENHYGICIACHEPIDIRRLEAAPEAEFCTSCQQVREALQDV